MQERYAHCTHRAKYARLDCMWITRGVALYHRGSRCLSLSCLTIVRRCPQICSNASCFALGTDLRGIRRIVFLLAMALLALSPPPGAEVEAQPQPERCNPRLRWKTALTIALLERRGKNMGLIKQRNKKRLNLLLLNIYNE